MPAEVVALHCRTVDHDASSLEYETMNQEFSRVKHKRR
jgi:hypothetical protein